MSGLISWRNWADVATLTAQYQGETLPVDSAFPLTNLQTRQLASICKLSSGDYLICQADLGSSKPIKLLALLNCSKFQPAPGSGGSISFVLSVRVSEVSDFSTLVHSGSVSSSLCPISGMPTNAHYILPDGISGRYVQVKLDLTVSGGGTSRQAGRLWIGDALTLPGSLDAGVQSQWSIGTVDAGTLDASAGLQIYESKKAKVRRLGMDVLCNSVGAFGFDDASTIHYAPPSLQALQVEAGVTGEVIVLPRTTTPLWMQAVNVYGHVERPFDIQHIAGPNYRANLTVVEER